MKVAIYARVSTRDKEQNPDVQLMPLRRYAEAMQWEIFGEYIDKASANDFEGRKGWAELMAGVNKHLFDVLLIWKLDRAFRSVQHASNTVAELVSYHISFRSYMDPTIDTTTPNGKLMCNILASVAEFEKDLDSVRILEGMEYARTHGTKSGKAIGKPRTNIPDEVLTNYFELACKNYSVAARQLTGFYGFKVSPGFVHNRIKRASQTPPQKTGDKHG